MDKKPVPQFKGTKKQEQELREFIMSEKDEPGALMPVLQKAQEIYGYLPIEVQTIIADMLEISLSEVYGVATFYAQFSLYPKGEHRISVCLGTACYVKGADKILEALEKRLEIKVGECTRDGLFSLDACRCVGACGLAPVMMIDEDVYGRITPDDIDGILQKYETKQKA
ncbi:MAG: NADH-quinone oxidoreductase subunit NuoE [Clostridia bacterium]|nr:NADH-quinone oxidoreductase subunit NuoE [Clostridia bacterium]